MRKTDDFYQVDGKPLPVPDAGVELSFQDLDAQAAGRDELGFMHRMVLREKVRTWSFCYSVLSQADYDYVMGLLAGKAAFVFTAGEESVSAYCSKVGITLWDRARGLYRNLKFNIIEC